MRIQLTLGCSIYLIYDYGILLSFFEMLTEFIHWHNAHQLVSTCIELVNHIWYIEVPRLMTTKSWFKCYITFVKIELKKRANINAASQWDTSRIGENISFGKHRFYGGGLEGLFTESEIDTFPIVVPIVIQIIPLWLGYRWGRGEE